MILETFVVGPFGCNCTVLADETSREAIVIDPGGDSAIFLDYIARHDLNVRYALHTHAHIDHVSGTRDLKERTDSPILLHKGDLWLYENLPMQAGLFGWRVDKPLEVDDWLEQGLEVVLGPLKLEVLHTPGHTPGSVCFYTKDPQGRPLLFSGDTLFAGSIGRTDLWGGSYETIMTSIHDKLVGLPERTVVLPGHGESTTIERERRSNPFVLELLRR
jgi:glyoxylase-like metal-dependent hydrolase (beta-lactamase superfamily II)